MTRIPDPFTSWPKPYLSSSSISLAAGRYWRRAEALYRSGGVDPMWLIDGALAYALDVLEEVRKAHRLGRAATIDDVLPFLSARVVEDGTERLRLVEQLLTYAIEHDDEQRLTLAAKATL